MRNTHNIDGELRLLVAIRHMVRAADGRSPSTAQIDGLLEERAAVAAARRRRGGEEFVYLRHGFPSRSSTMALAPGTRIGVFSDAPRELVDIALAHAGAARQVEMVGTLAEVQAALGAGTIAVYSREQLAGLR